jgi:uncharacterized protein YjbI with pentapeptide repeats
MRGVRLCAANLKGADFTGAVLEASDLSGAKLSDAIFQDTVMDGVDLSRLMLTPEQIEGCVFAPGLAELARAEEVRERLRRAEEWAASGGATGAPASIDDEDLRPLTSAFRGRTLTALSARRVRAVHLDFSGGSFQGAVFDGADLRGANFDGCDLRGASFVDAKLAHARFVGADLRPLVLPNGRHHAANFTGAGPRRLHPGGDDAAERAGVAARPTPSGQGSVTRGANPAAPPSGLRRTRARRGRRRAGAPGSPGASGP